MVEQKVASESAQRQGIQFHPDGSPISLLIADLQNLRDKSVSVEKRRRSAIVAGQLLILAREYQNGHRPNRRTLKRFFYFVAREAA